MAKSKRDYRDGISVYKGKFRISYKDSTGQRRQQTIYASTVQQARQVRAAKISTPSVSTGEFAPDNRKSIERG